MMRTNKVNYKIMDVHCSMGRARIGRFGLAGKRFITLSLLLALMVFISCHKTRTTLVGKWKVVNISLYADSPTLHQNSKIEIKGPQEIGANGQQKQRDDSVQNLKASIQTCFKDCLFDFDKDGNVVITTTQGVLMGKWIFLDGVEDCYVEILVGGNLFAQWRLCSSEFSHSKFMNEKTYETVANINSSGDICHLKALVNIKFKSLD